MIWLRRFSSLVILVCILATATSSAGQAAQPTNQASEPTFPTHNGPRTAQQLTGELRGAGYDGPWDMESMIEAYRRAGPPSIAPYAVDTAWTCVEANPSCSRDPWWSEWYELQSDEHVTYSAVGSRFITERRFGEATNLLWQSVEGKTLLRKADDAAVLVIALDYDQQHAYATYSPQRKLIAVNRRFTTAPTWMLADVLVHELSHASDDALGLNSGGTRSDCLAGETAAYQVERRFLAWLTHTLRPEGLPSIAVASAPLSPEHTLLARQVYTIGFSENLPALVAETYEGTC